jgi:uncharacterized protein YdeI (YjbR/CyaY-like superfamily)
MQTKKTDILASLVAVYKDLYIHKDLFTVDFKYSISEVENFYEQMKASSNTSITEKRHEKGKISDNIMALKTPDDVKEYLSSNNQSKDDFLKKLSHDEFAYLYNIIYSSALKSNMRKIDVLNTIEKYFNSISRAISMKP